VSVAVLLEENTELEVVSVVTPAVDGVEIFIRYPLANPVDPACGTVIAFDVAFVY
jgi:hypothetical protein